MTPSHPEASAECVTDSAGQDSTFAGTYYAHYDFQ